MKHFPMASILLLLALLLCGCTVNDTPSEPSPTIAPQITPTASPSATPKESLLPVDTIAPSESQASLEDYYPILDNTKYYYLGDGNEYASYDVLADYTEEHAVQERVSNGGTVSVQIIRMENGTITKVFSQGETYYRENEMDMTNDNQEVLLMEPLAVGTTWTLADGSTRTITNLSVAIDTALGTYQALEVTTKNSQDTTLDYYAKEVGLVKTIFQPGDSQVTSTLNKIENDAGYSQDVLFYYPDSTGKKLIFMTKTILFHTNDNTKQILADSYKTLESDTEPVFTQATRINSLYLNQDGAVYLDLSRDFLSSKNNSKATEKMLLRAVANTFGQYYSAKKVLLTVERQPYQTNTFTMKKGEFLVVDSLY